MLDMYTHTTSPLNDTLHDHYKPYQQEPSLIIPLHHPITTFPSNYYHYDYQILLIFTANHSNYNNIPNNQYLKGSTSTWLELMILDMVILATSVTLVKDPLVQWLTTLPLYLSIRGFQVYKQG